MNVLSLFDGISAGQIALERAGLKVDNYFASEIEKDPMTVTRTNYPNTIQLGDVTKWREWELPKIDLLIGGSPCQGFSRQGKQLNFEDPRSKLFFEFADVLNNLRKANSNIKFMLENVNMKREYEDVITSHLGVNPIKINSKLLSAQNRPRTYWTNIEGVQQPIDKEIHLDSILEYVDTSNFKDAAGIKVDPSISDNSIALINNVEGEIRIKQAVRKGYIVAEEGDGLNLSFPKSASRRGRVIKRKSSTLDTACNLCVYHNGTIRRYTITEMEKLQTLPVGYTSSVSSRSRTKALGNGWTVDVIAHIFKNLKEENTMPEPTETHPHVDMFGTSIDYNETYYILPNGDMVHCLNTDEYIVNVLQAQTFRKDE